MAFNAVTKIGEGAWFTGIHTHKPSLSSVPNLIAQGLLDSAKENSSRLSDARSTSASPAISIFPSNSSILPSLEGQFRDKICIKVDVKADCGFKDYLSPNEGTPRNVKPHLDLMAPGLIVSTGTERSFYDLLLSPEDKCTGLVVRDINPKVKAYVDFVTLLLRISESRAEFNEISATPQTDQFESRMNLIASKLNASDMPQPLKAYYLEHLSDFATIYFHETHLPSNGDNTGIDYRSDDQLFAKLQKYARAGNIIATIGSINDLEFLKNQKVSVVDTSNICDYTMLDLKGSQEFNPRIIWTDPDLEQTEYYSYIHIPLDSVERAELDRLLAIIEDAGHRGPMKVKSLCLNWSDQTDRLNRICIESYSKGVLDRLRKYVDKYIIEIKDFGFVNCKDSFMAMKLNEAAKDQIRSQIMSSEKITNLLPKLVGLWVVLNPEIYLAFMNVNGWKEAFEIAFSDPGRNLPRLLEKLSEHGLMDTFENDFGAERLQALLQKQQ